MRLGVQSAADALGSAHGGGAARGNGPGHAAVGDSSHEIREELQGLFEELLLDACSRPAYAPGRPQRELARLVRRGGVASGAALGDAIAHLLLAEQAFDVLELFQHLPPLEPGLREQVRWAVARSVAAELAGADVASAPGPRLLRSVSQLVARDWVAVDGVVAIAEELVRSWHDARAGGSAALPPCLGLLEAAAAEAPRQDLARALAAAPEVCGVLRSRCEQVREVYPLLASAAASALLAGPSDRASADDASSEGGGGRAPRAGPPPGALQPCAAGPSVFEAVEHLSGPGEWGSGAAYCLCGTYLQPGPLPAACHSGLLVGGSGGIVEEWDLDSGVRLDRLCVDGASEESCDADVVALACPSVCSRLCRPDELLVAAVNVPGDAGLAVLRRDPDSLAWQVECPWPVDAHHACWRPLDKVSRGEFLHGSYSLFALGQASSLGSFEVCLYDTAASPARPLAVCSARAGFVADVCTTSEHTFASASLDGALCLWDVRVGLDPAASAGFGGAGLPRAGLSSVAALGDSMLMCGSLAGELFLFDPRELSRPYVALPSVAGAVVRLRLWASCGSQAIAAVSSLRGRLGPGAEDRLRLQGRGGRGAAEGPEDRPRRCYDVVQAAGASSTALACGAWGVTRSGPGHPLALAFILADSSSQIRGTQFACSADCNYDMCLACRNTQARAALPRPALSRGRGPTAFSETARGVLALESIVKAFSNRARALLPPALANLPVIQPPVRFNGVVKSFNELKGFGFISCAEMVEAHGCDVFLHKDQRKEWKPNDEVSFIVRLNRDGKPQAYDLNLPTGEIRPIDTVPIDARRRMQQRTLGPGIPDVKEELGRHCGIVRSFDQEVGYGFVLCPEIHDMGYLHDVFVHHMQIGIFEKGDMIEFDAYLNSKGLPQCHNLSACHGERLEQLQKQLDELEAKRQRKRSHRKGGGKADRRQGGPDDPPGGAEAGLAPEGESLIEFGENGAPRPKKHYSFLEASVCKDWLHGTCERGDRCRFKHETESGQPVSETPCWDFVNGNCDRGDRCKFSHTVPEGEGKKGRGRGKGKGSGDRGQPKEQEVCRHFLKGWCNFGSGCRYLHTEDSSSSGAWRPSLGPAGGDEGGWAGGREPGGGGQRWGGRRRDRWADDYYDRIDSGAKRGWKRRRESWSELPDADSPQDGAGPLCREGHRLICDRRPGAVCDECGAAGTRWSCSGGCNFDLCAGCASE
ncbi:unnamed protein product, partial [Prorocentrum cordatum]